MPLEENIQNTIEPKKNKRDENTTFGLCILGLGLVTSAIEIYHNSLPKDLICLHDSEHGILELGCMLSVLGPASLIPTELNPLKLIEGIGYLARLPYDSAKKHLKDYLIKK